MLFAGRSFIFVERGHILVVAVARGGWVRGGRPQCGWKITQKNIVGWVDAFLEVAYGCP